MTGAAAELLRRDAPGRGHRARDRPRPDPEFHDRGDPGRSLPRPFPSEHGLETELHEVEDGRYQTIGRLRGSGGGPNLLYDGHLDIDPLPHGWKRNPFQPTVERSTSTAAASTT